MRRLGSQIASHLLLLCAGVAAAAQVEVTALANEGFLLRSASRSVLVDGLFRATAPYPEFFQQGPSEELLGRMMKGAGSFERIDVALVTHHHADHHDAATAVEFLLHHPETLLVGTPSVVATMREIEAFGEVAGRVIQPVIDWGSCADLVAGGVEVRVCRARHSGIPELPNQVYRVNLEGFMLVHEGDADLSRSTFTGLELADDAVDLAFVHSWWVTSDEGREALMSDLKPSAIVLMHHRWTMAGRARESVARLPIEVRRRLPPVTVFEGEGERRVFESGSGPGD